MLVCDIIQCESRFPFRRCFGPKHLTVINTYTHTDVNGCDARCQPAHQEQLWGSVSCLRDTSTCKQGESNQQPSDNEMVALPLSHNTVWSSSVSHRSMTISWAVYNMRLLEQARLRDAQLFLMLLITLRIFLIWHSGCNEAAEGEEMHARSFCWSLRPF